MSRRWEEHWAVELALGTLTGEERDAALAILEHDAAARAEVAAARELLTALPAPGDTPPAALREQVLKATEPASKCLGGFARRTGLMFDRDEQWTKDTLATIPTLAWEPGPFEGLEVWHLEGGPRTATADVGFVRMAAGLRFPLHEHVGDEVQMVLLGSFVTDDGREYLPGDILAMPTGSTHAFVVGKDEPCVIAIVTGAPIKIL